MKFFKKLLPQWRVAIPVILILLGIFLNVYAAKQFIMWHSAKPSSKPSLAISQNSKITLTSRVSTAADNIFSDQDIQKTTVSEPKFGHFPYPEGNPNKMMVIGSYAQHEYQRFERLAPEAALALIKLIYAARDEGAWIIPVSGFRSVAAQEKLFLSQIQRRGSIEAAVKLSAPPRYSEHATGYAIDLADGHFPKKDVTYDFAKTDAFKWLNLHAKEFGFELSFPENNSQGVSYEPWHWRFVGSAEATAIFKRARSVANNDVK